MAPIPFFRRSIFKNLGEAARFSPWSAMAPRVVAGVKTNKASARSGKLASSTGANGPASRVVKGSSSSPQESASGSLRQAPPAPALCKARRKSSTGHRSRVDGAISSPEDGGGKGTFLIRMPATEIPEHLRGKGERLSGRQAGGERVDGGGHIPGASYSRTAWDDTLDGGGVTDNSRTILYGDPGAHRAYL